MSQPKTPKKQLARATWHYAGQGHHDAKLVVQHVRQHLSAQSNARKEHSSIMCHGKLKCEPGRKRSQRKLGSRGRSV